MQTKTSSACGPVLALASIKNSFVTWLSLVMSSYWIAMRNAFIKWARAPLAAALPFVKVFDAVCINTEILSPTAVSVRATLRHVSCATQRCITNGGRTQSPRAFAQRCATIQLAPSRTICHGQVRPEIRRVTHDAPGSFQRCSFFISLHPAFGKTPAPPIRIE